LEEAKAPFLTYEDVNTKAHETLLACDWNGEIPVDVEAIAEFRLGMDIVPIRGLMDDFSVDGYLTRDLTQIVVDEYVLERHPTRYRFTLAHELGHRILHADAFSSLHIATTDDWKAFYIGLDEQDYGWFERHAYWFAGALLVPDEILVEEYESARSKLQSHGLADSDLSYYSRSQMAGALAKRFLVSTGVMQRRLVEVGVQP